MNEDLQQQLLTCDKEPIHIPGAIQPHGYLLAIDKAAFTIKYMSENISGLTGLSAAELLGHDYKILFEKKNIQLRSSYLSQLKDFADDNEEQKLAALQVKINDKPWFLLAHKSAGNIVLEFEPADTKMDIEIQQVLGASVSQILDGNNINRSLQNAAKKIKEIIHYERIMIYKFWEDGHGEVIAEEKEEDQEAFLGLHYPASDIPKQARELYKINLTRIIADVPATTVPLLAQGTNGNATPLDLTHSSLRAVSPIHIEYLKNMGVLASYSISLIVNNQLWGLIACHNSAPKFIDHKAREATKLIGQILSSAIEYREEESSKNSYRHYTSSINEIIKSLQDNDTIIKALVESSAHIMSLTSAKGLAIVFGNELYTNGITPPTEAITELRDWLAENNDQQIYHTESLSAEYKPAANWVLDASGLLACELSKEMGEYIFWFKPEIIKTVNWAGNPEKLEVKDVNGNIRISPRRSFESWMEQVKQHSDPWTRGEFAAVIKLREDVIQAISLKANQLRLLNEKLQQAYDELDTFSFTISHDLKTPLASVKNYTEILLEENTSFSDDEINMLRRIVKGADKMHVLINEVLAYSRIGRKNITGEEINMNELAEELVTEIRTAYKDIQPAIRVSELPPLYGDRTMLNQLFTNLLSNAVKYSSKKQTPEISFSGENFPHETVYKITDNGIGIDMSFGNQIFDIFKRMSNAASYEGSGVGLSIVKRIVERHNGKIWYESELGNGTVFYLSFPKQRNTL
ncbi:MAG: ATP-binding protein [Ferruginibacter sp.]